MSLAHFFLTEQNRGSAEKTCGIGRIEFYQMHLSRQRNAHNTPIFLFFFFSLLTTPKSSQNTKSGQDGGLLMARRGLHLKVYGPFERY